MGEAIVLLVSFKILLTMNKRVSIDEGTIVILAITDNVIVVDIFGSIVCVKKDRGGLCND